MRTWTLPQLTLVSSVTFTYSGTAAPMCSWSWLGAPDVTSFIWRMRQHGAWWHSLFYSYRYGVPQFHLPTINGISVIINLQGQPSSETPCSFRIDQQPSIIIINVEYNL